MVDCVINPATGRAVRVTSALGKKIMAGDGVKKHDCTINQKTGRAITLKKEKPKKIPDKVLKKELRGAIDTYKKMKATAPSAPPSAPASIQAVKKKIEGYTEPKTQKVKKVHKKIGELFVMSEEDLMKMALKLKLGSAEELKDKKKGDLIRMIIGDNKSKGKTNSSPAPNINPKNFEDINKYFLETYDYLFS